LVTEVEEEAVGAEAEAVDKEAQVGRGERGGGVRGVGGGGEEELAHVVGGHRRRRPVAATGVLGGRARIQTDEALVCFLRCAKESSSC